ncbi:MAG TPA: hypothetical protein VF933_12825, partial [Streptosporangiaceae bacterium]
LSSPRHRYCKQVTPTAGMPDHRTSEYLHENTNGLIREYFPKGTEIPGDMDYLWAVADSLNDRPRAILGFRKPSEVFAELMLQEAEISPA